MPDDNTKADASTVPPKPKRVMTEKQRAALRPPWKKGQSGNPTGVKGRLLTSKEFKEAAQADAPDMLDVVKAVARDKRVSPGTRIRAAEIVMDRGYGKAKDTIEHSGPEGGPIQLGFLTDEQLRAIAGIAPANTDTAPSSASEPGTGLPEPEGLHPVGIPAPEGPGPSAGTPGEPTEND